MPELSDDRLAAILASVADHLVVPTTTGVGDPSSNGSGPREAPEPSLPDVSRWRARLLVAAVVLVVVGVVGTAVAPVREAVAGWLGIGSTEIVRVPVGVGEGDPSGLPYLGDDLEPVDREAAERRLGSELPDTSGTELGPAPVLALSPEGGVILAWADGATTLWVRRDERPAGEIVHKLLTFDDRLERVDGLGDDAAIVEGPHVLGTPQRRLAAGTVLVWIDDGFELRLESDLDPQQMVEIAHAIDLG